jgi:two-component system, sensor histidine kinase
MEAASMAAIPLKYLPWKPKADAGAAEQALLSEPSRKQIRAKQVDLLYTNSLAGILAGAGVAIVVVVLLYFYGRLSVGLSLWAVTSFVWFGVGYLMWSAYRRAGAQAFDQPRWATLMIAGGTIGGMLWGVLSFFLDDALRGLEIPVFCGLVVFVVAATAGYAVYAPAAFGFGGGITLTTVVGLVSLGTPHHYMLAIIMLFCFGGIVQFGLNFNRSFTKELLLEAKQEQLIAALTISRDALEAANEARMRFFASASHDLRQPMHALGLFTGALQEWVAAPDGQRIYERLTASIAAMEELIDQLLGIANIDAGAVVAKPAPVSIRQVFDLLNTSLAPLAQAKRLSLTFVPTRLWLHTDAALLYRMLGNLISNAIRYTEKGRILVGCRRVGSQVRIDVLDTGCGIARENFSLIFEEFVQLGNPERDRSKGQGLGLAIVKRLAGLLACRVTMDSSLGRGSRFSLTLARLNELDLPPHELNASERAVEFGPDVGGLLVLVLDNEREIRVALDALLSRWEAFPVAALSCDDAIERLEREDRLPDLLLSDFRLGDAENGIQAIQRIRSHFEEDIPALLITGDTAPQRSQEANAAGIPLLHKPLSPEKLRKAIAKATGRTAG